MAYRLQKYLILQPHHLEDGKFNEHFTNSVVDVQNALQRGFQVYKFPFPGMVEITSVEVKFDEEVIQPEKEEDEE